MVATAIPAGAQRNFLERAGRLSPWMHRVLLLAVCCVLYGLWVAWTPLTEDDEARFTEATRVMVASHNYIIPSFNSAPRYKKPIFYYWVQAASIRLFGVNEVAARLPSALLATLLVLLVHGFLLHWLASRREGEEDVISADAGRGLAFFGAAALATALLTAFYARMATTDTTLTFFIALTCLSLLEADLTGEEKCARRWYLLAAVAAGLATLTKGPMGVVIPGFVWLGYHWRQGSLRAACRRVPWVGVIILFLLVAVPWYLATTYVVGYDFLKAFLGKENVGRFTTTMEGHGGDSFGSALFYYLGFYPLVALLGLFPYSTWLVRELFQPFCGHQGLAAGVPARIRRFCWVWVLVVIGMFTISQTKLPNYVHSIGGPLAILFALTLAGRYLPGARTATRHWADIVGAILLLLFSVVLPASVLYLVSQGELSVETHLSVPFTPMLAYACVIAVSLAGAWLSYQSSAWLLRKRPMAGTPWIMAAWTLLLCMLLLLVLPLAARSQYTATAQAGRYLRAMPEQRVVAYLDHFPEGLVYYSRHHVVDMDPDYTDAGTMAQTLVPGVLVVTNADGLAQLRSKSYHLELLREFTPVMVARVTGPTR